MRRKETCTTNIPVFTATTPRWQMWLEWLTDEAVPPRKRLVETLLHASLPASLLHRFACDCAARTLHIVYRGCLATSASMTEALHTKGRWLQGQCSTAELELAKASVSQSGQQKALGQHQKCALSVEWAMSMEPTAAARYASLHVPYESEYKWQCQHLTAMIERLLQERSTLLSRLQHRQLSLAGTLTQFQTQLEDALYRS